MKVSSPSETTPAYPHLPLDRQSLHAQSPSPPISTLSDARNSDKKPTLTNLSNPVGPTSAPTVMPGLNQAPACAAQTDVKPIISQKGLLVVLHYSPSEGEGGVPIAVDIELCWPGQSGDGELPPMKLRLVAGRTAIPTFVQTINLPSLESKADQLPARSITRLRVTANAPDYTGTRYLEHTTVPLTLQAVGPSPPNEIIDQVIFGSFTYWGPSADSPIPQVIGLKRSREHDDCAQDIGRPTPSPPAREALTANPSNLALHRPDMELGLVRTTSVSRNLAGVVEARLEWAVTTEFPHPREIEKQKNWSTKELNSGRRLVRFRRWQVGGVIHLSCEPIPQDDYDESDIVISCIHRRETRCCYFTSVDVIYLLERIVGEGFTVEEKNRIRRNLEGFKPITIAKHRVGCDRFFQKIMDFPAPKPRNIEKDVKVFSWDVLPDALDKIISKYSVVPIETTPKIESRESSGSSSPAFTLPAPSARETPQPSEELLTPAYIQRTDIASPLPHRSDGSSFDDNSLYPPSTEDLWQRRASIVSIGTEADLSNFNSQSHSFAPVSQGNYVHGYLNLPSSLSLSELSLASGHHGVPGGNYELNGSLEHVAAAMDPSMLSNINATRDFAYDDYRGRHNGAAGTASPSATFAGPALTQSYGSLDIGLPRFDESDLYSTSTSYIFDESGFVDYPLA